MAAKIEIDLCQISPSASEAAIRRHRVQVDRPVEKGGGDAGPMGGELFLAGVGGCFMSNLMAAIHARDARIAAVRTHVSGILGDAPSRFVRVELSVSAAHEDRDEFEKVVEIATRGCITIASLRGLVEVAVRIA